MHEPVSWLMTFVESIGYDLEEYEVWTSDMPKKMTAPFCENIIEKQSSIQFDLFGWGSSSTASGASSRPASTTSAEYSCCDALEADGPSNCCSTFFEANLQMLHSGLEAIIEDDVLSTFGQAPFTK
uniref:Uncharacterized protein n=1 Tax=Ditylenchus dipsaci TaxID=166011 RepID=A0A915DQ78_9BILA